MQSKAKQSKANAPRRIDYYLPAERFIPGGGEESLFSKPLLVLHLFFSFLSFLSFPHHCCNLCRHFTSFHFISPLSSSPCSLLLLWGTTWRISRLVCLPVPAAWPWQPTLGLPEKEQHGHSLGLLLLLLVLLEVPFCQIAITLHHLSRSTTTGTSNLVELPGYCTGRTRRGAQRRSSEGPYAYTSTRRTCGSRAKLSTTTLRRACTRSRLVKKRQQTHAQARRRRAQ